ncbi:tyrocidine synthase 3 [Kordia sp. SMS9]|uniref:non-ribosomal peptide synthetase n=1 Tax=Kordia sp. SMS9 TaxID=2282170 RepID=UPI000E0DC111|nr:non-ribosomal peptide synthetase [Kordia sp. SMS9]AXG70215.1 tyrocidine synthase 3 [Kordia sp. SMS9]
MDGIFDILLKAREGGIIVELSGEDLELSLLREDYDDSIIPTIKENKAKIIEYLKNYNSKKRIKISKASASKFYPLSFSQQRLWILAQFPNASIAYNITGAHRLTGNLHINALKKAVFSIVERHESLRTYFIENDQNEIKQAILPFQNVIGDELFNYVDLRTNNSPEDSVKEAIQNDFKTPFDLQKAPLLRTKLYHLKDQEYCFLFSMHHIISDGWSMGIFFNELFSFYQLNVLNKPLVKPPLQLHYKDFAVWQNNYFTSEKAKKDEAYWIDQFKGEIPVVNLPVDKPYLQLQSYNGKSTSKVFSKKVTAWVKKHSQQNNGTLFMSLLSLVYIQLNRYTAQKDIVLGTVIAGRNSSELENQIGYYLNTLALRIQGGSEETYDSIFFKTRDVVLKSFSHQNFPFERIIEGIDLKRELSRNPLFEVMVELHNIDNINDNEVKKINSDLTIETYNHIEHKTSKFSLVFNFFDKKGQLFLDLEYNTDLFNDETAIRLCDHMENLLEEISKNSELQLDAINYLSDQEKEQVVTSFNQTQADYSKNKSIIDLFREKVSQHPNKICLKDDDSSYTYLELDKRSNQIAEFISKTHGDDDKLPIAILLNRSAELIVVLLGILKSGRAYIPVDPNYPEERVNYVIQNSKANIVFKEEEYSLNSLDGASVHLIQDVLKESLKLEGNTSIQISPFDTAYIIYTSGSTGNPKGIEAHHQAVANSLLGIQKKLGIGINDTLFSVTTYSFDPSVLDFFTPLISGAIVYIASFKTLEDPSLIIEELSEIQPTILQATPSFYQMLLNANWKGSDQLRILSGGEQMSETIAAWLLENCSELWNMYGPTETTIWASMKKLNLPIETSNIGTPLDNYKVYVLDEALNPLPTGIAGSIYVAGDGISKGYFNNEQLTKERFVSNPFDKNSKMYNTGDIGMWKSNGELEFLGRKDFQVKIRGFRIELGEVESNISQFSTSIKQVVAHVLELNGEKALVAYYTKENRTEIDKTSLRDFVQGKLPGYMVPSFFVELEYIPLTPNGKVDFKALPSVFDEALLKKEYKPPTNPTEQCLSEIWQEILGKEKVGIEDNFFNLGGNSLTMIRVMSIFKEKTGKSIKIQAFYAHPTIKEIATLVNGTNQQLDFVLHKAPTQPYYPVLDAQIDEWIYFQIKDQSALQQNLQITHMLQYLNKEFFELALADLVKRHELLRTTFIIDNGKIKQKICGFKDVNYVVEYQDLANESLIKAFLEEDKKRPFDLGSTPLFRVLVIQIPENQYFICFTIPHILTGGRGNPVHDLFEIYSSYIFQREATLKPISYYFKDFAYSISQVNESEKVRSSNYWKSSTGASLPALTLATVENFENYQKRRNKEKETVVSKVEALGVEMETSLIYVINRFSEFEGKSFNKVLSKDITQKLSILAKEMGTNLFSVITAIIKIWVSNITQQEDIFVAYPDTLRKNQELNEIYGWLASGVIIKTKVNKNQSFSSYIKEVDKAIIEASEHSMYSVQRMHYDCNHSLSFHVPVHINYFTHDGSVKNIDTNLINDDNVVYELAIDIHKFDDGIWLHVRHLEMLLPQERMKNLYMIFEQMIHRATSDPKVIIEKLYEPDRETIS